MTNRSYGVAFACLVSLVVASRASAQDLKFALSFSGTVISNNVNGNLVAKPLTGRDWLVDWARNHGVANLSTIGLVYHLGQSDLGDAIEVVDIRNGSVLDTPFLLYFGEDASLGRTGLTNSFGTQIQRLEYVYTPQNSHSMGSFFLSERAVLSTNGAVVNAFIQGRMAYVYQADSTHTLQMVGGILTTGRRVTFSGQ